MSDREKQVIRQSQAAACTGMNDSPWTPEEYLAAVEAETMRGVIGGDGGN